MSSASIHQPPPVIVSFSPTVPEHPPIDNQNSKTSSSSSSDPYRTVPTQSVTPATPPLTPHTGIPNGTNSFSEVNDSSSSDPSIRRQLSSFAFPGVDANGSSSPLPQLIGGKAGIGIGIGLGGINRDRFESVDTVSTIDTSTDFTQSSGDSSDEAVEGCRSPDVYIHRYGSEASNMVANGEMSSSSAGMNGTAGQTIRLNSPAPFEGGEASSSSLSSSKQGNTMRTSDSSSSSHPYLYPSTHLDTFAAPHPSSNQSSTMAMRRAPSPGRPMSVNAPAAGAPIEEAARSSSRSPRSPTFENTDPFHPTLPQNNALSRSSSNSSSQRPTPPPREKGSPPILSPFEHGEKSPNGLQDLPPLATRPPLINSPSVSQTQSSNPPWSDSTAFWLGLYFAFNLGLTLFNKIVLVNFPFPYTLTGLHALSGCAGCYIALERGHFTPARLTSKENLIMTAFSVLYTINIAVSNLSLQLVTVPFHQVVRASTPLFTILISSLFFKGKFTAMKLVSLLPVVAGVGFATYGDYYFTTWGLILTLLGTFLAAFKTVITNVIQTGGGGRLRLHPLDLLMRMSPLAFIQCVIYGYFSGELERVRRYGALEMTSGKATALLVNGIIAFGLNVVSFTANKKAGPLTMTVSANCKQVMTIGIAVVLFNLHINFTNALGIVLTLIGGAWYGYVEYTDKAKQRLGKMVGR